MNRLLFILLFLLQTAFYIVWEQMGYSFGSVFIFVGTMVLVYFRRRYLQMLPYWAGNLSDIPKYFKLP
ncbi:hypothetical protein [uncultured Pontibacter sp.]|uniref:hypothetical protein n=1 Tax=uncultured Pontibacter sp. TaxID=453356 RepID=UPI00260CEFF6|nr:hypothetical protein [uncultured Pontibacter sp.]